MKKFEFLYEENKKLDKMFHILYNNFDQEIIKKNIVELLVELGELANETRCFKYWSDKSPSSKEIIMDEYADCIIMALYFCNMSKIKMNEDFITATESSIVDQFKELFKLVSNLNVNLDPMLIKEIFSNLINLGKLLNFSDQEIIDGCLLKINRNKTRFDTRF